VDKMNENRLRWFDRVMKREDSDVVRTIVEMSVEERIGRPKK